MPYVSAVMAITDITPNQTLHSERLLRRKTTSAVRSKLTSSSEVVRSVPKADIDNIEIC